MSIKAGRYVRIENMDSRTIPVEPEERGFLYCLRGSRSRRAMGILKKRGYSNVKSIGGISGYKGKIEK
jgi:rhodanese-related sulfurtransferase